MFDAPDITGHKKIEPFTIYLLAKRVAAKMVAGSSSREQGKMFRYTLLTMLAFAWASPAWANTWAEGLFDELSRDFGSVPRGQLLVHAFRLANNSKTPVHISSVRVSCGCTSARALTHVLNPGQETVVLAQMDSRRFPGIKTVIIYVTFDQPRFEEVRLQVQANSRDDLAFAPENIAFGTVKQGATPTASMTISFLNNIQIQIAEVKSDSNYIQPKVQELRRDAGEVIYQVSGNLRPDVPEGKWYTDIWLTTNNPNMLRLRVPVMVEVEAPGNAAKGPTNVVLGQVKAGVESDRKVVLRGATPFRITNIQGADKEMVIRPASADSKTVHILTVTIRPSQPGQISRTIRVQTDLQPAKDIEFNAKAEAVP